MIRSLKLSVIIINYNTDQLTKQAIDSVIKYVDDFKYEIIVVDNNSKTISLTTLFKNETYKDKVTFIQLEENLGFGKANNKGAEIAKGEYVFLLNSDAYLIDNSVEKLIKFMDDESNANVACCGPNLIKENGEPNLCYGNYLTKERILHDLGIKKLNKKEIADTYAISKVCDVKENKDVDYLSGAALMVRKSVIDELGLFNPKYFMYYEDMDVCFKYHVNDYRNVLIPSTTVVHIGGQSWINNDMGSYKSFKIIARSKYLFSANILASYEALTYYFLDYIKYAQRYVRRGIAKVLK